MPDTKQYELYRGKQIILYSKDPLFCPGGTRAIDRVLEEYPFLRDDAPRQMGVIYHWIMSEILRGPHAYGLPVGSSDLVFSGCLRPYRVTSMGHDIHYPELFAYSLSSSLPGKGE